MSTPDTEIQALYRALMQELKSDDETSTAAALLVLASELKGVKNELAKIALVLGADDQNITQTDVPDTMLALLSALKAAGKN